MKVLTICLLALLSIASCHRNYDKTKSLLKTIDSLTLEENYAKADSLLGKIKYSSLTNEEDKALYGLVKTQTFYILKKDLSDSLINFSIEYYKKANDKKRLAWSYYYKGAHYYSTGKIKEALLFIREAEHIEKEANLPELLRLLYGNMAVLNSMLGANITGIEYARKSLDLAIKNNDVKSICFAYNCIGMCYYSMGKMDSSLMYFNKILPYLPKINNDEELAVHFNNIGFAYYENRRYKEAKNFFEKSESIFPSPNAEINLAKTYYMLGDDGKADSMQKVAWPNADISNKAEMLQFLAERADRQGDFKASARFYKEAKAMQDSADAVKETEEAVNVQREYETKEYKQGVAKSKVIWGVSTAIAVALLAAWGAVYHRRKMNRAKEMIERGNKLTAEYTARITELERADTRHSHETQELRRKIKKLKDEQNAILSRGQRLYNDITAGGTTATWKKQDFDEFIEFYRVAHPQAVADAENGYRRLSSTNIFYLILRDMQVADDDAQRILCMTAGAMRTMKSRINARKTD